MPIKKTVHKQVDEFRKVELVPIDSVKLWDKNPRKNDQAVEPLAKILARHGQRSPVVVRIEDKKIYKGNTTWKALKKLGRHRILVQWESFESEAAATAYGIADNRASEFSEWDDDVLMDLLSAEEIGVLKGDMGFSDEELKGLAMEADIDKIGNLKKTDTGIKATIKIICKPEDRDDMRDVLQEWSKDCGFEGVVVK